ncbi:MAG TPA: hypothetical protein VFQ16_04295 [Burkholderiaceae bacterium]|nr:hypothetical protein [Burkholderiaceae bacterium]
MFALFATWRPGAPRDGLLIAAYLPAPVSAALCRATSLCAASTSPWLQRVVLLAGAAQWFALPAFVVRLLFDPAHKRS